MGNVLYGFISILNFVLMGRVRWRENIGTTIAHFPTFLLMFDWVLAGRSEVRRLWGRCIGLSCEPMGYHGCAVFSGL